MPSKAAAARKQPEPAEIPAGIIYIPLNKLLLSPRNVRKTGGDEDIESLAASIASRGLIHNLVVTRAPGDHADFYEVDAGGRRWRALQLLVMQRKIARNMPIPCKVEDRDQATETSLAENIDRIMMNPADEAEAYATIVARYADHWVGADRDVRGAENERVAHCARRFGVTERHVRQRLRLAALAPEILGALRDNVISLDVARAYATVSDQAMQLQVWKHEKQRGSFGQDAKAIRDKLAGRVYTTDHRAVRYVGVEAYEAAGGRVEPDLFFGHEDGLVLLDPAVIDRLVAEKSAQEAETLAQSQGYLGALVKPWNGADHIDPKTPEGFVKKYVGGDGLPEAQRAEALTYFQLTDQEDGSVALGDPTYLYAWVKEARPSSSPASVHRPETEEERTARIRTNAIRRRAMRLAAPPLAGSAWEGKAFWPLDDYTYLPPCAELSDGTVRVVLIVQLDKADVDAAMAEAEARYEQELAELAEEEAARAAEAEAEAAAGDEPEAADA